MSDLDQISQAIGQLQAAQEAHSKAVIEAHARICKRLDVIEAKVDPLVAYRNKLLGYSAAVATGASMVAPWVAKKLGLMP